MGHGSLTTGALGAIAYLVTFGSLVGYTAFVWLLEHVPVPKVTTYAYVNPVVAVILGAIFLGEHLVSNRIRGNGRRSHRGGTGYFLPNPRGRRISGSQ